MISTHVDTGNSVSLNLTHALLFYETDGYGEKTRYVEQRDIIQTAQGPAYGAGRPLDEAGLRGLLERDGQPDKLHMLDPRLLAMSEGEVAWWSPASTRKLIFTRKEMADVSGVELPMPAMVFHVRRNILRVRALRQSRRPLASTALMVAPAWNVYNGGDLCMGSMTRPTGRPIDRLEAWENAFWDSAFTGAHDARTCGREGGYHEMLREARRTGKFRSEWLVPSKEKLSEWLTKESAQ